MSLLSNLSPKKGSTSSPKRIGRGNGSGHGTTAARGNKGQKARSGGGPARNFEGGQMPLQMRLPKFGFTNPFRVKFQLVNLSQLEKCDGDVTAETLKTKKMIKGSGPYKIVATGSLNKSLNVQAHKFTKQAKAAIESAGGKAEVIKCQASKDS